MDALRAEVIWEILDYSQRVSITNTLYITEFRNGMAKCRWSELSAREREALLKIDWEFTLGKRFPQLNSK